MTLQESFAIENGNSNIEEVQEFSKAFRVDTLGNIEAGEEFTIPTGADYKIWRQKMMRGGQPVVDRNGNPVYAEYVKCMSNKGRIVNFFPSSLTKLAFRVDPETGKDVTTDRVVRPTGDIVDYCKAHPNMTETMKALQGCTIKCEKYDSIPVRAFGVPNDKATKKDVEENKIGIWKLVGEKKPENWTV
jgi:hypothetical protein